MTRTNGRTVVVVGGGYGGSAVAQALDAEADVVLVDPRDAFANVAGTLRALTQPDWAPSMFFPYAGLLSQGTVIRDRVVSADPGGVLLESGRRLDADYLVLATGSTYSYPARPDAESTGEALENLRRTHKQLAAAQRVLILGAGPVGLELAGEIKEVWPERQVTVVDPAPVLLPAFEDALRADLHRQLADLDIDVRLGVALQELPSVEPGQAETFTVATSEGDEITADIWFQAYGSRTNSGYLADGRLTAVDANGRVPVTPTLQVRGLPHVYVLGDLTDVPEAKMAGNAMQHAEVVAANIRAQLVGEEPGTEHRPSAAPAILLPLGTRGGVGQLPGDEGLPVVVPAETVSAYKGADLFTGRLAQQFGRTSGDVEVAG